MIVGNYVGADALAAVGIRHALSSYASIKHSQIEAFLAAFSNWL